MQVQAAVGSEGLVRARKQTNTGDIGGVAMGDCKCMNISLTIAPPLPRLLPAFCPINNSIPTFTQTSPKAEG